MPTYDYECDGCGHKFELFQGINAPVETKCPACKKKKLRRLFGTGGAIVFKGSGFYQTDYRSDSYKKGASAEKSASEPKSTESKSSESSKPAESKSSDAPKKSKPEGPSKPEGKSKPKSD